MSVFIFPKHMSNMSEKGSGYTRLIGSLFVCLTQGYGWVYRLAGWLADWSLLQDSGLSGGEGQGRGWMLIYCSPFQRRFLSAFFPLCLGTFFSRLCSSSLQFFPVSTLFPLFLCRLFTPFFFSSLFQTVSCSVGRFSFASTPFLSFPFRLFFSPNI